MISWLDSLWLQRALLSFIESITLVVLFGHLAWPFSLRIRPLSILLDLSLRLLQHICVQLVLCLAQEIFG